MSNVGTWMQRVAQDWLVLELTGGGWALGVVVALQCLSVLLLAPFAGRRADRRSKRPLIAATQTTLAGSAAVLGALTVTGSVRLWHVFALAAVFGAAALDTPARMAFVAELVPADQIPSAAGMNAVSFNLARLVGPAAAGLLIAALGSVPVGAGWVICVNALSYVAVLWALAGIAGAGARRPPVDASSGMFRAALRYASSTPAVRCTLLVVTAVGAFGVNFQLTVALMVAEVFGRGVGTFGVLGSLLAAHRGAPTPDRVVASATLFAVVVVAAGLAPTLWSFAVLLPMCGATATAVATSANTLLQCSAPDRLRGRVLALYVMAYTGATACAAPAIGLAAAVIEVRWVLIAGVSAMLAATAAAWRGYRHRCAVDPSTPPPRPAL